MYVTWGFAALWNLISAPLPFLVYAEFLEKNNKAALIGLLFPVIGLALLFWALRRTLEWRRFGAAPIALDPFPGAIGGHVGGTIDVGIPYSADAKFALTLTNLRSHISGTGKNRSRRETADWQDTLVAHTAPVAQGTRLSFRFDVPEGLAESDADRSKDDYHLWRLHVQAELPGIDIDRDYEIPVYATAASSRQLGEYSMQQARSDQRRNDEAAIRKLLNFSLGSDGRRLYQPMGRTLAAGLAGFLFGAVFAGAGWFLGRSAGHWFMGGIFGFVGAAILVSGLYFLFNSLEVRQSGDSIESIRRILGIQVRNRRMRRADFQSFDKKSTLQTQSGGKKVMHYSVYAIGRDGTRVVLGEGFRGASQADTAADMIGRQFGLSPVSASRPDDDPLGPD